MTLGAPRLLAHAGGWDEALVFGLPVLAFWLLQRRRRKRAPEAPTDPSEDA